MERLTKTKQWYTDYYMRLGKDRNNILTNKGVFFQSIAKKRSFVKSLSQIKIDSSSNNSEIEVDAKYTIIILYL